MDEGKPLRSEPTWRIPAGVLALFAALAIYAMLVASLVAPLIAAWPGLAQAPVYVCLLYTSRCV